MPFVPATNVLEVAALGTYSGEEVVNVWHVEKPAGSIQEDDLDNVAGIFDLWYSTDFAPLVHTSWTHNRTRVRDLSAQDGLVKEYAVNTVGQRSGSPLPGSNTVCISLRSGLAGRSRRGRKYFSGSVHADLVGADVNLWSTAHLDDMRDAVAALNATLTGDYELVIVSKFSLGAPRATALVSRVTAVVIATGRVTSQRGRLT